jgi:hypothetical protein
MSNKLIGEYFARLYCKEKGIKAKVCSAAMLDNSTEIQVRYEIEGKEQPFNDYIQVGTAIDMLAKRISKIETMLVIDK